jgi:phytoene dehydrogenase-like protein
VGAMSIKPAEMVSLIDKLKMLAAILPLMGTFRKYRKMTLQEFAQRFRDSFLRDAIRFFVDSPGWPLPRFPMVVLAGFLKEGVSEAGVPLGGSQGAAFRVAENYQKLGGKIHYKSRVKEVVVENDQALGVRLEDGTEHRADMVVWAGDSRTIIFDILGGRYIGDTVRSMYSDWTPVLSPVHVMLGVARDLSKEPHLAILEAENPITIAGEEHRWPGFTSQIEVVDVATPTTYVRYTGNWRGSPDGWYATPENLMTQTPLRSLPGLSGFHMVGQGALPYAGVAHSALSGRQLIQLLCKRNGKPFVTTTP